MEQSSPNRISMFSAYGKIKEILEAIEQAEEAGHGAMIDVFINDIMTLLKDSQDGIDRCIGFIKYAEVENLAIEQEIGRLLALKKSNVRGVMRVKELSKALMDTLGVDRLEGKFKRSFSLRESSSVEVLAADQIPDSYLRVIPEVREPNKELILKELRAGRHVSGTQLKTTKSVVVK